MPEPKNLKITPVLNNLVVEIEELPTDDIVRLPDNAHRYPYGAVIAVGPDCKFCKIGDKLLFMVNSVIQFNHPEGNYFILNENSVLGKYEFDIPNN